MRLAAGIRWDRHEDYAGTPVSPHASLGLGLTRSTQLQLGWGQYLQYPDLQLLSSTAGGRYLLPERSNHFVASVEQRLNRIMRVRVEAYQRENRDVLARPFLDPRLVDGRVVFGPANPLFANSVRGYSRGIQIMVQSRSANRLSGWASYTLGYTRDRDSLEHTSYWSNEDQRHTINLFTSYRIRPSVNVSGKWAYGSSTPLPGFFRKDAAGLYYIAPARNEIRLSDYQRLDLRVNKSFIFDRWKLTLYGELINATNHKNYRMSSYNSANASTGRASISIDRVFPILPSGGIMLEF